ncbi:hypothetical protein [Streptomyces tauricus]
MQIWIDPACSKCRGAIGQLDAGHAALTAIAVPTAGKGSTGV